jgi:hypothetical protein
MATFSTTLPRAPPARGGSAKGTRTPRADADSPGFPSQATGDTGLDRCARLRRRSHARPFLDRLVGSPRHHPDPPANAPPPAGESPRAVDGLAARAARSSDWSTSNLGFPHAEHPAARAQRRLGIPQRARAWEIPTSPQPPLESRFFRTAENTHLGSLAATCGHSRRRAEAKRFVTTPAPCPRCRVFKEWCAGRARPWTGPMLGELGLACARLDGARPRWAARASASPAGAGGSVLRA